MSAGGILAGLVLVLGISGSIAGLNATTLGWGLLALSLIGFVSASLWLVDRSRHDADAHSPR